MDPTGRSGSATGSHIVILVIAVVAEVVVINIIRSQRVLDIINNIIPQVCVEFEMMIWANEAC